MLKRHGHRSGRRSPDRTTGEPDDVKVSRPVRRGAAETGPGWLPRRPPTLPGSPRPEPPIPGPRRRRPTHLPLSRSIRSGTDPPSFVLAHRVHEDGPAILRPRARRLLVRRHQPTHRQLPTPRLLAPRLETAVALLIPQRLRQPVRCQRRERRVLADPT